MKRYAKTRNGKKVALNTITEVAGGWDSYVIGFSGYAIRLFIPRK